MTYKLLFVALSGLLLNSCVNDSAKEKGNPKPIKVVFDVPALLGKNIDEVRTVLGKPSGKDIEPSKQQMEIEKDFSYWDNEFLKDSLSLIISFDPRTRKVKDYFISGDQPIVDVSVWEKQGNLNEDDQRYSVTAVDLNADHSKHTGITITPNK